MSADEPCSPRNLLLSSSLRRSFLIDNGSINLNNDDAKVMSPSIMSPPSSTTSPSMRRAAMELLNLGLGRSRRSIIDVRDKEEMKTLIEKESVVSIEESKSNHYGATFEGQLEQGLHLSEPLKGDSPVKSDWILSACRQIPAIAIASILNLMISIPFGVSYFPIGWRSESSVDSTIPTTAETDDIHGPFPLANKEALGIRMFLFSTIIGQIVFTFASKFKNPVALQMVENVPFFHSLAFNVITVQGYGIEALSTLFFLFGLSSVLVGLSFYTLGTLELGRIVYFFPNHVLVGCIGGIGVFIAISSIEVSTNTKFTFSEEGLLGLLENMHLIVVVVCFEAFLRILLLVTQDTDGRSRFPLLSPAYFCMITPLFYLGLWLFGVSTEQATESGYFFPATIPSCNIELMDCVRPDSVWSLVADEHLWDMFKIINFNNISWQAVIHSVGTIAALVSFSALHIPINIPAFAISTDVDTDMNAELIAHGYSNAFSGLFGGLQNYMTYSNSVLYARSGGEGKVSSLAVAATTCILFVVGPRLATSIPRCMAGTLLLHIGVDLFMEGVYDSFGKYDNMEYAGIWLITIVMTSSGMTAALIAGIIAALSTYVVQSVVHPNPIRSISTAATLRSSAWNRCAEASNILDDEFNGRSRILLIQLQGYLFFGNIASLTDTIKGILKKMKGTPEEPCVVIIDFGLVVGMDSSASHAVAKLKVVLHKLFHIHATLFVTGSEAGFPCEFALSQALSSPLINRKDGGSRNPGPLMNAEDTGKEDASFTIHHHRRSDQTELSPLFLSCRVCGTLDEALIFAEDVLIARQNPEVLQFDASQLGLLDLNNMTTMTSEEESVLCKRFLANLCPSSDPPDAAILLSHMTREEYKKDDVIWSKGMESDCLKLLVKGTLISFPGETQKPELIRCGNCIGELGLVNGTKRLSTVVCLSASSVVFSMHRQTWELLSTQNPNIARMVMKLVIKYLFHRLQHVSESRNLPI